MKERDVVIDIDSSVDASQEAENPDRSNELIEGEHLVNVSNVKVVNGVSPNSGKNTKKEKRKSMSAKKHPKPPRPPRGLSLDAADQKLIKEISELAMIKRARIERMKALKRTKEVKALSVSASSSGNFVALLFTVLFCIVIIFQGCHSSGVSLRNNSAIVNPGSPNSNEASTGNIIAVSGQWDLTTTNMPLTNAGSPDLMERFSRSYNNYQGRRMMDK
ncbi:hypothetical protein BUALT_Bualt12G0109900 [Buddleja alternifolia]|uniref:Transmembrane protein n=1 Tax=Buddleja alternifolia TaxID=168488 RepID=A0AAV6WP94_9LAMI|nr:hypothetical protein BUALT_Bualt12G0109900 [Buddleja alternifolia]